MLKLYFGNVFSIISFILILGFVVLFCIVTVNRSNINYWGVLVLCLFFLGLAMSILSGFKDGVGTPNMLFSAKSWTTITLTILGIAAIVLGVIMIFVRTQSFWQFGFYALSADIIIKTLIVEISRVILYIRMS
jgi:hypothetical protein